jgi:hypothetical protein
VATLPPGPPISVRRPDAIIPGALGIPRGGALLTRPDGMPTAWIPGGDAVEPALRAAVDSALGWPAARLRAA